MSAKLLSRDNAPPSRAVISIIIVVETKDSSEPVMAAPHTRYRLKRAIGMASGRKPMENIFDYECPGAPPTAPDGARSL